MSPLPLTDPHHMAIKPFLLLGLSSCWIQISTVDVIIDQHCRRPSGSRCKSKTGLKNQDRSRLSTNHRRRWRDRSRPVLRCNAPQIFMTLTGELSWQRLRRSAVDFYSQEALLLQRNRRNFAVQENWHFGTELNQTEVVVEAEPNPCNLYWYSAGTLRYIFPGKRKHRNLCCTCE